MRLSNTGYPHTHNRTDHMAKSLGGGITVSQHTKQSDRLTLSNALNRYTKILELSGTGEIMKTFEDAQRWIILASLSFVGGLITFILLGTQLNYPLDSVQARHLIELAIPPFIGYLSASTRFVIGQHGTDVRLGKRALPRHLPLLLKGSIALYSIILIVAFLSFYIAN